MTPPRTYSLRVPSLNVTGQRFVGGPGPERVGLALAAGRRLDWTSVRRHLPAVPRPAQPVLIDVISDLSGSMIGGNDVTGCRHEAVALAAAHLAAGGGGQWWIRLTSFDLRSPIDLPLTRADRRGLRTIETVLLAAPNGSSSNLGPSIAHVEAHVPAGRRILVVLSDFELFDDDLAAVLQRFASSAADERIAIVFGGTVPALLSGAVGVTVVPVDRSSADPATVARVIVEAAGRVAPQGRSEPGRRARRGRPA